MVKRRQTNRTTLKKRKVYRRKTRGGHSPIHVSPHPPSPLFRRPSHTPPTSKKPGFSRRVKLPGNLRRTKYAKVYSELRVLAQQQERINDIFARGSRVVDDAALKRELEQYEPEPKH